MNSKKSIYEFFKSLDLKEEYNILKEKFHYFLKQNSDIIKTNNPYKNRCVEIGKYIKLKEEKILREKINKDKTTNYNIKEILNAKKA